MRRREFWREIATGNVWAIEMHDGVVVGCQGPLHENDLEEQFLDSFEYTAERADWIDEHREAFSLYSPLVIP